MNQKIKLRARERDGMVVIKTVIQHPMHTGKRKIKKTGKKIPPHYIKQVLVSRNQSVVMEVFLGKSIARNPFLSLQVPGQKGDFIKLAWLDNRGNAGSASAKVR